ncbi:MAG: ribosomal protein S18-alanine N-acetyltransferase [Candidatus Heimdallarchaeaceae archaeon]
MSKNHPKIMPMKEEDITKVFDVERKSFPFPFGETLIGNIFFGAPELCLVIKSKDEIIGFILGGYTATLGQVHILSLAILENYRNQGLGRELLEHFIKRTEILGYNRIKLEVDIDNSLVIQLYESLGFVTVSRIRKYYQDNSDAFLMVRK